MCLYSKCGVCKTHHQRLEGHRQGSCRSSASQRALQGQIRNKYGFFKWRSYLADYIGPFRQQKGTKPSPPSPQVCVYSKGRLGPLVSTDLYPGERDQDVTLVTAEVTLQSEIRNLGGLVGCTCTLSQQERQKQAPTAYHWVLIVYSAKSYKA